MRKRYLLGAFAGILLYFVIVYFSVGIEIEGLQEQYSIGDDIDFSVNISGIGNMVYSYSIEFEKNDESANIMGVHHSGPEPTYLDPPFSVFSEKITYNRQIEPDAIPGIYTMKFRTMDHTVEKTIQISP